MPFPKISILGCGWLGLPLAKHLIASGYSVSGSTTTPSRIATLKESGIHPFLIDCSPQLVGENIDSFFQSDILFLNIPFRRDLQDPRLYFLQIQSVVRKVLQSKIKFVIFASSTSVYPESLIEASEDAIFVLDNSRSEILFETEKSLLNNKSFKSTIIRFAGLCGGERKVGRFLAGAKNLGNPKGVVNLIHLDDCIAIVSKIIEKNIQGEIFNAVCDNHPTRERLYTDAAVKLGLQPPEFDAQSRGNSKTVLNTKLKQMLTYQFQYPDPLEFP